MNNHRILIHNRNQLMVKLMWLFLLLSILVNSIVEPVILVVIIPTGLFCCLVASLFVAKKWLVTQTPAIIVTVIFLFFITLVIYEPLFINFVYIWFALILSSIYQQYKPILLAGIYSLAFTIYTFYTYHEEVFPLTDQEDIAYLGLFSVLITIFLIYASKFNENLQVKLEQEKNEAEEMLRKSEKLAVVGQLAAGVAHEIRNPLAVISGFIQMMEKDKQGANHREIMLQELNRINLIISEFLVFSKPQSPQFETKDLKKIVSEVVTLLEPEALLKDTMINFSEPKQDMYVECEKNQIKQVLINLLKNAIEAMPKGGNVMVELLEVDGSKIRIKVTDEGLGIPEDQITKLGEPFFTTKDTGTGLGLMVSQKIIENHQGKINFISEVGNGTTVEVDLPQKNRK